MQIELLGKLFEQYGYVHKEHDDSVLCLFAKSRNVSWSRGYFFR